MAAVVGISLLITLHELGHYLVARACGMRVLRFSVGFGPALISRQFGDTVWQLAAIPLGGFVQIQGMAPGEDNDPAANDPQSFLNRPVWQRMATILAGPAANWLLAAVFLAAALMLGVSQPSGAPVVGGVLPESPAANAGLQTGDRFISIDGAPIEAWNDLGRAVGENPGKSLDIHIEREGTMLTFAIVAADESGQGRLGVRPSATLLQLNPGAAVVTGLQNTWAMTGRYTNLLWGLITGAQEGQLSGLPGIVKMANQQADEGVSALLGFLAWLSIGLFLLNLLPVPGLDGGRFAFLTVELLRGRPVNEEVEARVHGFGLLVLLGLMIFVSVRDIL